MNFILESHFDGVIVRIIRRFNLIWIPQDKGYKLGPPGGLADPIRNVRNVKKTQGGLILEDTAVLMKLVSTRI